MTRPIVTDKGCIFLYRFPKWSEFQSFQDRRATLGCEQWLAILLQCTDGILVKKLYLCLLEIIMLITVFARISAAPDKVQPSNKHHIWEKNVKISAAPE